METGIHIGNKIDKTSREELGRLIDATLSSAFKNHTPEGAIVKALDICREVFAVNNVYVSNSVFSGDVKGAKK